MPDQKRAHGVVPLYHFRASAQKWPSAPGPVLAKHDGEHGEYPDRHQPAHVGFGDGAFRSPCLLYVAQLQVYLAALARFYQPR